jgi:hypothetical protein
MQQENTMAALTELQELESIYCDLHKDVYGVKARWYKADDINAARTDIYLLEQAGKVIWEREQQEQADAAVRFEKYVQDTIKSGAKDRATALRWIHDAEGTRGDDEFLCYNLGLRYGYFKQVA